MYTVYAGAIIALLLGVQTERIMPFAKSPLKKLVALIPGVLVGALIGAIVAMGIGMAGPHVFVKNKERKLVAMRSSDVPCGIFIWGSSISTETVYRVVIAYDDGSMRPFAATADQYTRIIEDANLVNEGRLIEYSELPDPDWFLSGWGLIPPGAAYGYHYEYHVPEGTVRNTLSVR